MRHSPCGFSCTLETSYVSLITHLHMPTHLSEGLLNDITCFFSSYPTLCFAACFSPRTPFLFSSTFRPRPLLPPLQVLATSRDFCSTLAMQESSRLQRLAHQQASTYTM